MDKLKNNIGVIMVILGLIGSTGTFYSKFATMELTIQQLSSAKAPDLSGIDDNSFTINDNAQAITTNKSNLEKEISILNKEIELLKLQLQELKISSSNPLQ